MKRIIKNLIPREILKILTKIMHGNYNYFLWLFPIKKDKIVICNYYGKGYGDNGKYIVEEINRRGLKCEIVWLLRKELIGKVDFPRGVRIEKYGSFAGLYELATAKVWIDNCRKTFFPPKRKGQYYIQTWHGGIALKQIEKDVEDKLESIYVDFAINDSKMADFFISNSNFCTNMYKSSFWYDGPIIEVGSPRCDILLRENSYASEKVRKTFNIDRNTKILVYAPTFRVDLNTEVYNIDFNMLLKKLENKFNCKWNIIIRLHPNISFKDNFMTYSSSVINGTNYDDMYELLAASDILITDYSSTMFEFSYTGKPVFLYAPDIEEYIKDRGFYFDIKSLPYPLAQDNSELLELIEKFDKEKYDLELNKFLLNLGIREQGNASSKVVDLIEDILKNQKLNNVSFNYS